VEGNQTVVKRKVRSNVWGGDLLVFVLMFYARMKTNTKATEANMVSKQDRRSLVWVQLFPLKLRLRLFTRFRQATKTPATGSAPFRTTEKTQTAFF